MQIVLVVAAARNRVIGRDGRLPWRLPSELRRFKAATIGHPCLMGRRTWQSIGRPLPDRDMIVLTHGQPIADKGVLTVSTLEQALTVAKRCAQARGVNTLMVIGGGEIYRLTLPLANQILYTEVETELPGDTVFPELDAHVWLEGELEAVSAGPGDDHNYTVRTYWRRASL